MPHPPVPSGRLPRLASPAWGRELSFPGPATDDAPGIAGQLARLRATVAAYVADRRDAGAELDRVLPEVRALVAEAELAEGDPDELGVLMAQVVRWAVEAYVDEPEPRHVPRSN